MESMPNWHLPLVYIMNNAINLIADRISSHLGRPTRRQWLQASLGLASGAALPSWAQAPLKNTTGAPSNYSVVQIVDLSAQQQDVSRDFLTGARVAWLEFNRRGGLRGSPVQHVALETDGSATALQQALQQATQSSHCLALTGTCGDAAAMSVTQALSQRGIAIAHSAPWLQNSALTEFSQTFTLFAGRKEQIAHALRHLTVLNVKELGVVYASALEFQRHQDEITRAASALRLQVVNYRPTGDLQQAGRQMDALAPALLMFVGGTPELAQFTRGLERQGRQRYVMGLADVNLQNLAQLGGARTTPVIAAQVVPMTNSSLPVVRQYRESLARYYDEAPAATGLAGYISARYTQQILSGITGAVTRESVLAAFARRAVTDIEGFVVNPDTNAFSQRYVTQSMLTTDGRIVG